MRFNTKSIKPHAIKRMRSFTDIGHKMFSRPQELKSKIIYHRESLFEKKWLQILFEKRNSHHFIITDKTVEPLYATKLHSFLKQYGINASILTVSPGEQSKSLQTYQKLMRDILNSGIDSETYIIGLGGGVVNNIAGFIASTLYRGIGLIQIPTTLLAQVDVAIDFKQAINSNKGKNHIGSYYPASLIVIDPDVLQTLPIHHLRNGLAESIKHALTQNKNYYLFLEQFNGEISNEQFLDMVITQTIKLKISLLNRSLNTKYSEMLPQYGHALGHALEHISRYKLLHGEAIAIGMCVTAEIALMLGVCSRDTVKKHYKILSKYRLPTIVPHFISNKDILKAIQQDKHYFGRSMQSILVSQIGSISHCDKTRYYNYIYSIDHEIIAAALQRNRNSAYKAK